jgi:hypothetical protein
MTTTSRLRVAISDSAEALQIVKLEVEGATGHPVRPEFQESEFEELVVELRLGAPGVPEPNLIARARSSAPLLTLMFWAFGTRARTAMSLFPNPASWCSGSLTTQCQMLPGEPCGTSSLPHSGIPRPRRRRVAPPLTGSSRYQCSTPTVRASPCSDERDIHTALPPTTPWAHGWGWRRSPAGHRAGSLRLESDAER